VFDNFLQALISRHNRLEGEVRSFKDEIKRLDELSQLMTKAASEHNVSYFQSCPVLLLLGFESLVGSSQWLKN